MSQAYARDLDRNAANHAPLTPLSLIARTAEIWPGHPSIVHGARRYAWGETYARCRRLACALARHGVGAGDTVAVMLANTPQMVEVHFGIPMAGAVINTLNTRLDAAALAFMLDHSETKVLVIDTEFAPVIAKALKLARVKPLVIDVDDPEGPEHRRPGLEAEVGRVRGVPRRR